MKQKQKAEVKPVAIVSFDQLQAMLEAPVNCEFEIDGVLVALPVKRMSPGIAERKRALENSVQPPWDDKRKDFDPLNKKYIEDSSAAKRKARALVIYYCCPVIAAKKPGLASEDEIVKFIQECFTENILERLLFTADWGGVNGKRVAAAVNFTSPDGLGQD